MVTRARRTKSTPRTTSQIDAIVGQLRRIRSSGGDGQLAFGEGATLAVTNLDKPFFPDDGIDKGDVMEYYARMSPILLPLIMDRPLILKRYPDGIDGPSFFQQRAGSRTPRSVRTSIVRSTKNGRATRIVGGDLPTLLYLVQIGTIAVHAWQSRLRSLAYADTATIDLDPGDHVSFSSVATLARYVKAELDGAGLHAALKTSGVSGLHIAIPLPPKTGFDSAAFVAQRIAERVAEKHPKLATVARPVRSRPKGTIYVDARQNAFGKSVVVAYSLRERAGATVSMPLDWRELRTTLRIGSFTIASVPARVRRTGDLWSRAIARSNSKRALESLLRSE